MPGIEGQQPVKDEFVWTEERNRAAVLLAQGYSNVEVAAELETNRQKIWRWSQNDTFAQTVDEMSLVYGAASKAFRLRLLNQAIRQKIDENDKINLDGVTFLDLMKEIRMNTEGIRLGILEKLIAADEQAGPVAGSGQTGSVGLLNSETEETE